MKPAKGVFCTIDPIVSKIKIPGEIHGKLLRFNLYEPENPLRGITGMQGAIGACGGPTGGITEKKIRKRRRKLKYIGVTKRDTLFFYKIKKNATNQPIYSLLI